MYVKVHTIVVSQRVFMLFLWCHVVHGSTFLTMSSKAVQNCLEISIHRYTKLHNSKTCVFKKLHYRFEACFLIAQKLATRLA